MLALPFAAYLYREGAPGLFLSATLAGALLLGLKGVLEQLSYYQDLAAKIRALPAKLDDSSPPSKAPVPAVKLVNGKDKD